MNTKHTAPRATLLDTARAAAEAGLNAGSAGNASIRLDDGFLVTPSGLAPADCRPADMVEVRADGGFEHALAPSSEWRLHRDIYHAFAQAGAVIHTHAPFAAALACQRAGIPPFHYMIARFGGSTVRCAAYATFGTQALSDAILAALEDRCGCLLANHGMVVYGRDAAHALALAIEFETLCEQYWRTCLLGPPVLLSAAEMDEVTERFRWYGRPQPGEPR